MAARRRFFAGLLLGRPFFAGFLRLGVELVEFGLAGLDLLTAGADGFLDFRGLAGAFLERGFLFGQLAALGLELFGYSSRQLLFAGFVFSSVGLGQVRAGLPDGFRESCCLGGRRRRLPRALARMDFGLLFLSCLRLTRMSAIWRASRSDLLFRPDGSRRGCLASFSRTR
jgi:hypothetical protein